MDTKKWYQSLTINAGLVAAVISILTIFGIKVGNAAAETENIAEVLNGIILTIASVLAIIGRIRAKTEIGND